VIQRFYVTTTRGLVPQLERELHELGAGSVRSEVAGCRVRGPLEFAYRICLWSRVAHRVLLPLEEVVAESPDELYEAVRAMPWEDHVAPQGSVLVDFTGQGRGIVHTRFGAQRVKDGIVDRFRDRAGVRPSVDRTHPDLRVNVHARGRGYSVALDLGGDSLHRRGYRIHAGAAPIKETLAAGLIRFSGWRPEEPLVDPMCGSGTIPIEAAMMAADVAPGSLRAAFGFERWLGHDAEAWQALQAEARERSSSRAPPREPTITGCDRDASAVDIARAHAERAGIGRWIRWEHAALSRVTPAGDHGWVVTNPPYGVRLGDTHQARAVLEDLGRVLGEAFRGHRVALVLPDDHSMSALGLSVVSTQQVDNGPVEARFVSCAAVGSAMQEDPEVAAVANRLTKNLKRLRKWARREGIECYRVYDADIPQYNAAIDVYGRRVVVAEYEAPKTVNADVAAARLTTITAAVSKVLEVAPSSIVVKVRKPQRGTAQYRKQGEHGRFLEVTEGGHRLLVNLSDYLDTGLFLDHRATRAMVGELARGRRFLNLFCYTGTFTVYAARAGAVSSVSVDLSKTYLDWAARNLALNAIDPSKHLLVRADVRRWLDETDQSFDLVVLDPPTFSNSKAMEGTFDVQRDHEALVGATMRRLAPEGILVLSTNARRFRLAEGLQARFSVEEITGRTVPEDFRHGPVPHRCWLIRHRPASLLSDPVR
jgi:23S rRNA (guanine2445-N2)-methyltransferase / 23S rRNA (guanine2069-N7)-methyltransferase